MPGPRVGLLVFGRSLFILLLLMCSLRAPGAAPVLSVQRTQEFGWHRILGTADAAQVYTILGSTNLANWNAVATLLDRPGTNPGPAWFSFLDPASAVFPQRFYHLVTQAPGPTNDWKNQVYFPGDPFADTNVIPGNPRPIKFVFERGQSYNLIPLRSVGFFSSSCKRSKGKVLL